MLMKMNKEKVNSIYSFTPDFKITKEIQDAFNENGYIVLKCLLSNEETTKLRTALESDEGILKYAYGRNDGQGLVSRTCLWNQPGNDITGMVARSEKVAGTMEKLLGGEVYHYHSKVILKEARTGGAFVWHQDYGYWYNNGNIFPNMGTVWIALDKTTRDNGCVQMLSGSHRIGRIDHGKVGEQAGADIERVEHCKKIFPLVHAELDPGDVLFFHCNVLHCSSQNKSNNRRWGFLVAYNRADNDPVSKHHHPNYSPLNKVPDSAILDCSDVTNMAGKDFFGGPNQDVTLFSTTLSNLKTT